MTNTNCGPEPKKSFFDFVDEVFIGDLKEFSKKFKDWGSEFRREFRHKMGHDFVENHALMNVIETKQAYRIEIAAPGLSKESFKISLHEQVLKIVTDIENSLDAEEKYLKQEFDFGKLERTFYLPEDANPEQIEAKYEDGLLKITVAKKEPEQNQEREIKVS
ncbi:MAG: Hsp20/alpha crystallin family protein [Microscillaceae bacterium]|nr:Hsp20/alpha crystallin family protein [Microscillaceae bacterium]